VIESAFIATRAKAAGRRAAALKWGLSACPAWGRQAERVRWPAGHQAQSSVPPWGKRSEETRRRASLLQLWVRVERS